MQTITNNNFSDVFSGQEQLALASAGATVASLFYVFLALSYSLSFVLLLFYISLKLALKKLREEESFDFDNRGPSDTAKLLLYHSQDSKPEDKHGEANGLSSHILRLRKLMASENPQDWKLAVTDADILLKQVLLRLGVENSTVGEMLKTVDELVFKYKEDAWQAHKIRNDLAHKLNITSADRHSALKAIEIYYKILSDYDI